MNLYVKIALFFGFMAFSSQAELESRKSFKKSALFERVFTINPEVENWTNLFFAEFFKKELSNVKIHFFEETDMSFGFIEGGVSADLQKEGKTSLLSGDFVFYVDPENGKESEYGLHFETEFSIQYTDPLFYFAQNDVALCEEDSASLFLSFCQMFKIEDFNSNTNKTARITENLYRWKESLTAQLYEIEDPEIKAIQPRFTNWIADHILIEESEGRVALNIDLSGMRAEFESEAKDFLKRTQLIDYSFESIRLEFLEDQIFAEIHLKKLHVVKRIKLYLELASLLQDFIEDEERGVGLAQSLREALKNRSLSRGELISHISSGELINLGWTAGVSLIRGDDSPEPVPVETDIEEELGLD